MKYKIILPYLLVIAIFGSAPRVWAGQPTTGASPRSLYQKALNASHQGNYVSALRFIQQAKVLYAGQGNQEGAYRAGALEYYLRFEKGTLETKGRNTIPDWIRNGWLLKNFSYSGTYIIPPVPSAAYHGLLIFLRKVRDIPQGPGRSVPIWGILATKSLPKLKPGEEFVGGSCKIKGRSFNSGIAAIVLTKGQQNQENFTIIRKAWFLNPRSSKIETIPANQVVCANEGYGV